MLGTIIGVHAPSADLAHLVEYYQSIRMDTQPAAPVETVIPAPRYSLIFQFAEVCAHIGSRGEVRDYPRSFLAANSESPVMVRIGARTETFRVAMRPHTIAWLTGTPATELVDGAVDLDNVLGVQSRQMLEHMADVNSLAQRVQVFECGLREYMKSSLAKLDNMEYAIRRITHAGAHLKIRDLAAEMSVSERQLERWFLRSVGLGPKSWQRIARINSVIDTARRDPAPDWAALASDFGFSDQSHLVREFVAFTGMSPGRCMKSAGVMRSVFQQGSPTAGTALRAPLASFTSSVHAVKISRLAA